MSTAAESIVFGSFSEVLEYRSLHQGTRLAFRYLEDGEARATEWNYTELDSRARIIGQWLSARKAAGERVLVVTPSGLEYVAALFGCFYAGAVAVPAYPLRSARNSEKLWAIQKDCGAKFLVTTSPELDQTFANVEESRLQDLQVLAVGRSLEKCDWTPQPVEEDRLALLQYTSASTGSSRAIRITHSNLLHNSRMLRSAFEYSSASVCVSWLPVYHDMGLIGGILQPVFGGFPCTIMSPTHFLQRPARWLEAISRFQATISGGPNFAYDLCVRRVPLESLETLDLKSWSVAFNGSEPVRAETMDGFAAKFERCRFRRQAFFPCYGLAESTLIVSGGPRLAQPLVKQVDVTGLHSHRIAEGDETAVRRLSSSGQVVPESEVLIVHPESRERCEAGEVGEIWVRSKSCASGYWNSHHTPETFHAYLAGSKDGPFLRTGDLGFMSSGHLFVTGRIKDLIIIRGLNYYPQDVEYTVQSSHPALAGTFGAAFSLEDEQGEQLGIVQEINRHRTSEAGDAIAAVRSKIFEDHGLRPQVIIFVRQGTIPRTTSGKVQRYRVRNAFLQKNLVVVVEWKPGNNSEMIPAITDDSVDLQTRLQQMLKRLLELDEIHCQSQEPLVRFGLDSLGAVEICYLMKNSPKPVSITEILGGITPADLFLRLQGNGTEPLPTALPPSSSNLDLVSFGQQALWFLQQREPESSAYNIAQAFRFGTTIDPDVLTRTLRLLLVRHSTLRTIFPSLHGNPKAVIRAVEEFSASSIDAQGWTGDQLQDMLAKEAHRPFRLDSEIPLRAVLLKRVDGDIVLFVFHHIAADFWSLGILLNEFTRIYQTIQINEVPGLPAPPGAWSDYVRYMQNLVHGSRGAMQMEHFRTQFEHGAPLLSLPVDKPRPARLSGEGASVSFSVGEELSASLQDLCATKRTTLSTCLLSAFSVLLRRYSAVDQMTVGMPTWGRVRPEFGATVGYFVNPVVLNLSIPPGLVFSSLLSSIRSVVLSALENQEYPFSLLVEKIQHERGSGRSPLFQAMFSYHQIRDVDGNDLTALGLDDVPAQLNVNGMRMESIPIRRQSIQYELTLAIGVVNGEIRGSFKYSRDLFHRSTIEEMARHYTHLLEQIVLAPERPISQFRLTEPGDMGLNLSSLQNSSFQWPSGQTIQSLFEYVAEQMPDAAAVRNGDDWLTYHELNRHVNRLAHRLRQRGLGSGQLCGVCMGRSVELPVAVLAILKTGAGFVPLDPSWPPERMRRAIDDGSLSTIVVQSGLEVEFVTRDRIVAMCLQAQAQLMSEHECNPPVCAMPDSIAYVVYTSGSTGQPKGVVISQSSLVHYLTWVNRELSREPHPLPMITELCFDASMKQLLAPLIAGRTLWMMPPDSPLNMDMFIETLASESAVALNCVPSLWRSLLQTMESQPWLPRPNLKQLMLGGEAFTTELAAATLSMFPKTSLWNLYGPTEITVNAMAARDIAADRRVTLGQPVGAAEIHLLDTELEHVPAGVPGQIFVGGPGVARCYLNEPAMTAAKFLPNPFSTQPGARFYRTGDVAHRISEGQIEFLGRADNQIKIRGYRIETGEIESVLRDYAAVEDAAVVVSDQDGSQKLIAYLVLRDESAFTPAALNSHLKAHLPSYMVPAIYFKLRQLPRLPGGKVDIRNLDLGAVELSLGEEDYCAPRNQLEERLAAMWAEALGVERVGIHGNFFVLGGHSLLATQIVARLQAIFSSDVPLLALFFEQPTVAAMAAALVDHYEGGADFESIVMMLDSLDHMPAFTDETSDEITHVVSSLDPADSSAKNF